MGIVWVYEERVIIGLDLGAVYKKRKG